MPDYWEIRETEWEAFQRDMAEMSEEMYLLWIADMEKEFA